MTTTRIALTLTTLAALSSSALAKGNPDPKLPKEVQVMYCLIGEWTFATIPTSTWCAARCSRSWGASTRRPAGLGET